MSDLLSAWGRFGPATPERMRLAGRAGGMLWLTGVAAAMLMLALPGEDTDAGAVGALALCGLAWGAAMLALAARGRVDIGVLHVSTALSLAVIAGLDAAAGGADAPTRDYVWPVVVFASLFFGLRHAVLYWLAAGVVAAAPLVYDGQALDDNLAREILITVPLLCAVGASAALGRHLLGHLAGQAAELESARRGLAEERSSLRRIAAAVGAGSPPQGVFALVSAEAGRLLGGDGALIARYLGAERIELLGSWSAAGEEVLEPGQVGDLAHWPALARLRENDAPVRIDEPGGESLVAAPIYTGTVLWGALTVTCDTRGAMAPEAESRLADYATVIATAIANAEDRERLQTQAGSDPLTGLPNYRAFRERIDDEISRAHRHDRPLTLGIVDIDRFHEVNDRAGFEAGDRALAQIARTLTASVRDEDVVARVGGDQFGVLFVESDRATALSGAERARCQLAVAALPSDAGATVTVGLCDLGDAHSVDELMRRAGAALRFGKARGRDGCWIYDPQVVHDDDLPARLLELDRPQALAGLRALARAIDAKDPATREHSERVAALAGRLAAVRGWAVEHVERLRDAAVVHDVGKIGVPDAVLLKPERLDDDEMAVMRDHAALGARIVADVLDDEQVTWVARHHERPDGAGYPRGLREHEIDEGAALLALADAWDAMVSRRAYSGPMAVEEAIDECRTLAGTQFIAGAVSALEVLHERGELLSAAPRARRPARPPGPPPPPR